MSRSGGMSQLLKGVIIGVVLIMAIIGTMSLLDKDDPLLPMTANNEPLTGTVKSSEINPPSITLNPNANHNQVKSKDNSNIGNLNAELPSEQTSPVVNNNEATEDNTVKPVLEDERTSEEALAKESVPIDFGMMEINAINPNNNQTLKVNYLVYNQKNIKVAESNNASNASYRLPVGQYKVETTLTTIDQATNQTIPLVSKSRYIIVRANTTTKQTFELEPPSSTGVLQVSAKMNNKVIRADFVIQKANGEVIASRNNVTNSLFKLDSGTYKVSVTSGNNIDFKSIEVKAGESTQTVFTLKQAEQQGKLLVRVFEKRTNIPIRADINISSANGGLIQAIKASTQTELSLAPGDYKIQVVAPNGSSNKNIRMNAGQALNEVFHFEIPNTETAQQVDSQNGTQITENVIIKPVEAQSSPENSNETETITTENNMLQLSILARDEQTKKPMKSNVYIQTTAGKHLDKRTYVDSASFSLKPGVYKVTVRANNRNNVVKTIRLENNTTETFLLVNPNKPINNQNDTLATNAPSQAAQPVSPASTAIPTGFLNVSMQAPNNQRVNPNTLKTHFIVAKSTGEKIVELTSVANANFKLDIGSYIVTAIHNNKRRNQRINIRQNQNARLVFNNADFQAAKGILRSRIVDELGRPLKGNLSVTNATGQIVARANAVATAVFNLAPARHTISVNYQGLSGSEVVNINANETTVQTFTIAPNQTEPQNTNSSRDIKDLLRDKIKKEIRKQF